MAPDATVAEPPAPRAPRRHRHGHRSYGPVRRWLMFRLSYLALRTSVAVVRCLPRRLVLWVGEQLGAGARLLGIRRRIVRCNLAFVGYPPDEQSRIERRLYRLTGRYFADMVRGGDLPFAFDAASTEVLDGLTRQSAGVLFLFSHLGNWEVLVSSLIDRFPVAVIVAKPLRNPLVNRWLERLRQRRNPTVRFVPPVNALRQTLRSLHNGGCAAFAIDQYGGSSGLLSPFLGKPTSTVRSTAGIEGRTGCPVMGTYALLGPDNAYRVVVEPLPASAPGTSVQDLLDRHNALISAWIRQHPEHWFGWFHRRFKDVVEYV